MCSYLSLSSFLNEKPSSLTAFCFRFVSLIATRRRIPVVTAFIIISPVLISPVLISPVLISPALFPRLYFPKLCIIGNKFWKIFSSAGPAATSIIEGRINKKIGNTSFTPIFAAFSSASCFRRILM